MNYYELLGIQETATPMEIKKAYFAKVRQYTPENAPDMFREIRQAYDTLSHEDTKKSYDKTLKFPDDPRFEQAMALVEEKEFPAAIERLKGIEADFPDAVIIKEALGETYEKDRKFGLAANMYEDLIRQYPDNQLYTLALARNYAKRKYTKKAKEQFEKAVKMNPHNPQVWAEWILEGGESDSDKLNEMLRSAQALSENMFAQHYEVYYFLWYKKNRQRRYYWEEKQDYSMNSYTFFSQFIAYYKEDKNPSEKNVSHLLEGLDLIIHANNPDDALVKEGLRLLSQSTVKNTHKSYESLKISYSIKCIEKDERFEDVFHDLSIMEMAHRETHFWDEYTSEEDMMLPKAYILVKCPEILDEIILFKKEYPDLYALHAEFLNQVLDTEERKQLEKSFRSYMKIVRDNIVFYAGKGSIVENTDGLPFKRDAQKVGRNDPCPCGSGKKYKKCCGS